MGDRRPLTVKEHDNDNAELSIEYIPQMTQQLRSHTKNGLNLEMGKMLPSTHVKM